jgi:hypothetical protein
MKWKGKIMLSYLYVLCSIERKDNLQMIRKKTETLLKAVYERSSTGADGKQCETCPRITGSVANLRPLKYLIMTFGRYTFLMYRTFDVARPISFDTFNSFNF